MAEYIKVNKVISYIKGYAKRSIDFGSFDLVDDILTICENIKKMSAADVVEVVRCEKCAFAQKQIEFKNLYVCLQNERFVKKNDFCSYGERKTDNEKI